MTKSYWQQWQRMPVADVADGLSVELTDNLSVTSVILSVANLNQYRRLPKY
ncbi:MAG: hypothetical protein KME08_08480 [Aphanothece sp. CMT-3BRIN-NPC111]|nr:hypothetical protein [Aphanothece sp. CMT-3BRIN-NPC111]